MNDQTILRKMMDQRILAGSPSVMQGSPISQRAVTDLTYVEYREQHGASCPGSPLPSLPLNVACQVQLLRFSSHHFLPSDNGIGTRLAPSIYKCDNAIRIYIDDY
jgi:hypothetical protein